MERKWFLLVCPLIPIFIIIFTPIISSHTYSTQSETLDTFLFLESESHGKMRERLDLDKNVQIDSQDSLPTSITQYDGLILIDYVPSSSEITQIQSFSQSGGGILIITGPDMTENASLLIALNLITRSTGQIIGSSTLPRSSDIEHPIISNIAWNSVPSVLNASTFALSTHSTAIIENSNGDALIFEMESKILIITIWPEESLNTEFLMWPYANYLFRLSELVITGTDSSEMPSYADWEYSPVPHLQDTTLLGIGVLIICLVSLGGFLYSKKYSKDHPILKEDLETLSQNVEGDTDWEDIGMHRQISGFLVQLFVGMLIILPNAIMTSLVFPLLILPSPQAVGFYDFTYHFFEALWLIFDLGTATVLVKFFSEHRVEQPQQAVKYIQVFIWYQVLSGLIQLFFISFLGSFIFPRTFLAHMSWVFITHAFFQWPAFFIVFLLIFRAMNRLDYFQILNILLYGIFTITLQYLVIVLFRAVLGPNIIFGDSLAGAIGYSIGNYVIRLAAFLTGLWMFKRLGFSVQNLFRIDFTTSEIKESLTFGAKWVFGNMWVPLGWFLQVFLLAEFLPNYTEQQGFFSIAWGFAQIVMLVGLFAESMLGGISESFHAKRKALTQYYTLNSLKWGAFFDFYFVAILLAIGPRFILGGAGQEWVGAAILIPWILIFHAFGFLSWLGDWMFAGSDRPGWAAISWVIEQSVRAILLIVFIQQHAFFTENFGSPLVAVMFAYIPALIIKVIYMWTAIRRSEYFQFKWKDLTYQGIITPVLTGIIVFILSEIMCIVIWGGDIITSVIILLIGTFPMIYIASFIFGVLGGFDDNTLAEFKRAAYMAKGVGFLARGLYWAADKGANMSP
ncbi:MAG: lipopolysaccharide biosynthesis protein, partial [Promethearchaeota archaeon]